MLGLPDGITACLFDLDGVLTKTAVVHERAWKAMFDEFLGDRGHLRGVRLQRLRRRQAARGRDPRLPRQPRHRDRPTTRCTTLSERKNDLVLKLIHDEGVERLRGQRRLPEGGARRRPAPRRRLLEPQLRGRAARHGPDRVPRGARRRPRDRRARPARQARAGLVPGGRPPPRRAARPGGGLRGRAGRRRGRPRREVRPRRRRRPRRPPRRRCSRTAPTSSSTTSQSSCDHAPRVHASSRGR